MNLYDVEGYDRPLLLSEEHAESIGATLHEPTARPKGNASLAVWTDYALGRGVQPEVLEGMTRTELVEHMDTFYPEGQ